ncbi:hypothetical protein [Pseudomonas fluorescens]|uniref:hypothetical protein n=1 Tax=Pseudomonas fluorescens TaxID=294 RepID=UPI001654C6D8|nr:hypothetical protein [Pseudomonas fluorescens]MBC8786358.1 hypothetical protein [Pseudomonas fluorescens]
MNTDRDPRVDLGADMFSSVAELFIMNMEAAGYTEGDDQAVIYAGFISTVAGYMCQMIGHERTQSILESVKQAAAKSVRSTLKAVKV